MWLLLAVMTTVFTAARDVLVKRSKLRAAELVFVQYCVAGVSISFLSIFLPPIEIQVGFTLNLILGSLTAVSGMLLYYHALSLSDISLMIPIRSLAPVIVLVCTPFVLDEDLTYSGISGVLIIFVGMLFIGKPKRSKNILENFIAAKGTPSMLGCVLLFAVSAIFEKRGIIASSAVFFSAFECSLCAFCMFFYLKLIDQKEHAISLTQMQTALPVAVCFSIMFLLQCIAMGAGPLSYIISFKRASIIITTLFGALILKEQNPKQRIIGSVIVFTGAVFISMSV